jgi:hypothetical protein
MIFKIFSPKNSAKKLAFLTQNKAKLCQILIITSVSEKNANFFRRKLAKIAENCDHNIDPWSQSNDHKLKIYNATSSLARFEIKDIFFYFEKRASLLQRWRCSCKFNLKP